MQGNYAHYRFGSQVLKSLPQQRQRSIQRFRQMYTMGTYGPDIFYFHNPLTEKGFAQAEQLHGLTGEAFFTRCCEILKNNPSEAGQAYLFGLLSHYCLDSACRDFIRENLGLASKTEIGVEFDRFLLTSDGKTPACSHDFSGPMKLTRGECVTVSAFYPPMTPAAISSAVGNMRRLTRWLTGKNRKTLARLLSVCPSHIRHRLMASPANHKCLHLNEKLLSCYVSGVAAFPELARQLTEHLESGAPLGEGFGGSFH